MKILWLSHLVPYPPKGGVLQRAYHLLHELSRYHEVDLIAFHQPDLMRPLVPSMEEGLRMAEEALSSFCGRLAFVPIESEQGFMGKHRLALRSLVTRDPYTINWLKSKHYAAEIDRFLQTKDYDLVHLDTISLLPYFKQVQHLPTVLDHHNIESHMLLRRAENETHPLKAWYFRQEGRRLQRYEEEYCPRVDLNITCSEMDLDRLKKIVPGCRAEEVPNGVDVDYFSPDFEAKQNNSILFVGTLNWYPNVEAVEFIAHELWPLLKRSVPGVSVDIIGASPPQDIVDFANNEQGFHVHGFVDDIRPYFNRASVYVCPIMDGGGTKLKVLDALAMGKALVAHEIACEGINVQDGENVIFAETGEAYVAAIRNLLENEERRKEMGRKARELAVSTYAYESIGKKLSALCEQLTASPEES
jgi:sugar transferase (PEP-CTERM/EpsH1 system associated)